MNGVAFAFFEMYGFHSKDKFNHDEGRSHAWENLVKATSYMPLVGTTLWGLFSIVCTANLIKDLTVKGDKFNARDTSEAIFMISRTALSYVPCGLALIPIDLVATLVAGVIKHRNKGQTYCDLYYGHPYRPPHFDPNAA